MNKDLLYKYFMNEASSSEMDEIISWIKKSKENLDFFAEQKALWEVSGQMYNVPQSVIGTKNKKPQIFRFAYFSAAAIVTVLLILNLVFNGNYNVTKKDLSLANKLPVKEIRTLYTEKGVKAHVVLPDNSVVWLNSDSKITYPAKFDNKIREVELSGEAYFEVTKDSLHPMIVKTNKDFSIEVLGTSFSVKSYDNDNIAKATLFTGSISMHYKDKHSREDKIFKLKPSESFVYYQESATPKQIKYKDNEKEIAWKNGELLFEQTPMEEVIKMLERWHGTKFIIENKSIFNDKLTASFQTESIIQIMEMMKYCIAMDYKIENNVVTITKFKN
ncbi:MAG: FecR family protein [Bacteroidales bacterium]